MCASFEEAVTEMLTTNVLRAVGKKAAAITLICDILKGVVAIIVAIIASKIWTETNAEVLKYLAGLFAILGHTFPIFFEFRGGKGVATALGILITLNWKIGLICLIFAVIIIAFTKHFSLKEREFYGFLYGRNERSRYGTCNGKNKYGNYTRRSC